IKRLGNNIVGAKRNGPTIGDNVGNAIYAKTGNGIRSLALAFDEMATDGVDHAMDADFGSSNPVEVYFALDQRMFLIDFVNFDITKRIPIGFKNDAQHTFHFTVDEILNFSGAEHVYMHDKLNDTYFEITNDVFQITLPAGNITDRFEITFTDAALGTQTLTDNNFAIVQNNPAQKLSIANPDLIDVKSVILYDLTGKRIFEHSKLGARQTYEFSTDGLSEAVYIVKVITNDNRDIGQKISVFRTNK
ncbi:MAG: T9SS type A sorting domain-containing protein, partial [Proteobacteria bacterium]